jgi:hypothetical protein
LTTSGNENNDESKNNNLFNYYSKLAKVADVGLGPQTPSEQVRHQRLAKLVVELDRMVGIVEQHPNYHVTLFRIRDHDDYGKSELLVAVPKHRHKEVSGLEELAVI